MLEFAAGVVFALVGRWTVKRYVASIPVCRCGDAECGGGCIGRRN